MSNANGQERYQLWDDFLRAWPAERLLRMTLDEYTQAGSKETFTYWIESKLDKLGSIWGGSAFKFGIYSRDSKGSKVNDTTRRYSDTHGWLTKLGATAEEAFDQVRSAVHNVALMAQAGNLEGIDKEDTLGDAYKWKIAFHYQQRTTPCIVNIFIPAALQIFTNLPRSPIATLQRAALQQNNEQLNILEFGDAIWNTWQRKKITIWKLSHGRVFTEGQKQDYKQRMIGTMEAVTKDSQGPHFADAPVGTLFYLCHGNSPQRICQFTSPAIPLTERHNWAQRSYRVLREALSTGPLKGVTKRWAPGGISTFSQVPDSDLTEFEQLILRPYFGIDLAELSAIANTPEYTSAAPRQQEEPEQKFQNNQPPVLGKNIIFYGPPGTGKTYQLHKKQDSYIGPDGKRRFLSVTFHQSYGYEEFMEGLRPVLDDTADGQVRYEIRKGAFLDLCERARREPHHRFAIFIDEINRGNVSKIFGELITLIETDKRDKLDGSLPPFTVQLPYSGIEFSVPANLDIYGSMNTADRSLALVDTALRRRFEFIPVMPNPDLLAGMSVTWQEQEIDLQAMLTAINERIEALYDRDHTIGHGYFMSLGAVPDGEARFKELAVIFRNKILPLLEEYFFEDWQKIQLVLGDNQKSKQDQFIQTGEDPEAALTSLFSNKHTLSAGTLRPRFNQQQDAFENPLAYIGIY